MSGTENTNNTFYKKLFGQMNEGLLVTMTLPGQRLKSYPVTEYEKAAKDIQGKGQTENGYICIGIRKEGLAGGTRGSLDDLIALPALYGDYDVLGPAHKQKHLPKTKEEVVSHLQSLKLPPSLIVDSGYGLQPYWILKNPMRMGTLEEKQKAKTVSENWGKYLAQEALRHGWKIDNVSDPARMLRAPGTKNHKQKEGILCKVIYNSDTFYEQEDFELCISDQKELPLIEENKEHVPLDFSSIESPNKSHLGDASRLLDRCACIKTMEEEPNAISEPLWYALCTNVVLAKGGAELFQKLSSYYSDYKRKETDYKIKRALDIKRPCTCEYIQKTLCFECPMYCQGFKAPIVHAILSKQEQLDEILTKELSLDDLFASSTLGLCCWAKDESPAYYAKMKQKVKKAGVGLREFEKAVSKEKRKREDIPFEVIRDELALDDLTLPGMKIPRDFMVSMDGVQKVVRANGFETLVNVCSEPIVMSRRLENIDSNMEKVELTFRRANRWKTVILPRSVALSKNPLVSAADTGLPVTSGNAQDLIKYLSDFEAANKDAIPFVRSISRIGWFGDEFYPFKVDSEIVFEHEHGELSTLIQAFEKAGNKDEWIVATAKIREEPFARALLAASFASPLLERLKHRVMMLHIWNSSRSGKTAALKLALSIWGNPQKLMGNFNSTLVGMERSAGMLKHLPLGIDELQVLNEKKVSPGSIIYSLGNGYGKTRGNRQGGLQPVQSWRNAIITTGEQPLSADSSLDGITSRVMELYGKPIPNPDIGRTLHQISESSFGHGGSIYIKYLIDEVICQKDKLQTDFADIRARLKEEFEALKMGEPGVHLDNVSVLVLADYYASLSVFEMPDGKAKAEALMMGLIILENIKSTEKQDMVERAWEFITGWVAVNQERFSSVAIPCFGVIEDDRAYIVANELRKALEDNGFNNLKCLKGFRERGYLSPWKDPDGTIRNQSQKKIKGINVRTVCIKLDVDDKKVHPLEFPENLTQEQLVW